MTDAEKRLLDDALERGCNSSELFALFEVILDLNMKAEYERGYQSALRDWNVSSPDYKVKL